MTTLAARLAQHCEENKPEHVKACLVQDGSGNSINSFVASSSTGRRETPLHICARTNAWMCAKHLLESGRCDLLLWNDQGKTALRVARDLKSDRVTELLENFALNRLGAQGGVYNQQVETPLLVPLPHTFQLRGGSSSSCASSQAQNAPAAAPEAAPAAPVAPVSVHTEES